ncbi:hypothetical protein Poly41_10620 [Novipirellula artificiosorum]|uniref:Uncharacterized protein n=1 Tax=Novipirellula artificiosorum TaxID=2528016 RepID=A0A5C6E1H8_9BACT|nr:hypothetical protein Poly41_10620 [Novipirellula artificiosorum]
MACTATNLAKHFQVDIPKGVMAFLDTVIRFFSVAGVKRMLICRNPGVQNFHAFKTIDGLDHAFRCWQHRLRCGNQTRYRLQLSFAQGIGLGGAGLLKTAAWCVETVPESTGSARHAHARVGSGNASVQVGSAPCDISA